MSDIGDFSTIFSLKGKVAVVTGGSRGLGLHAATGLLRAGCSKVYITSRKAAACTEAVAALNALGLGTAISIPADLAKVTEVERLVAEVSKSTDKIDILLANAGATWGSTFDSHRDEDFSKVMDLNVKSVFNCIRLFAPLLEKGAKESGGYSKVITTGSVTGIEIGNIGEQGAWGYAASKAAVHHLTKHLSAELGHRGILCNSIAPGFFVTKMASGLINLSGGEKELGKSTPNGRLGLPQDIAGVVVFLASRAGDHVNGAVIPIDGGAMVAGGQLAGGSKI